MSIPEVPVSRSPAPLALAVGSLYAVVGALELAFGQQTVFVSPTDHAIEWTFAAALAGATAVLLAMGRSTDDRATRAVLAVAAAGHAALVVAATGTALAGREVLDAVFPMGVLLTLVGLATLAVQDLRKRVEPPRAGLVLVAGFALAIPADALLGAGSLVLAAAWLALGRLLTSSREFAVRVPA